jgi:hypothetical protein
MALAVSANNGQAPASALSTLPGYNGDGSAHTAPHVTAASYARVRAAMQDAGLGDLLPSDGWSCYRDRAAQQHMRDLGLTTIPVGQSIHGEWTYGSAVDLTGLGGFGAARHNWLKANGPAYGWRQPSWAAAGGSLPEPWHWEYDERDDQHAGEVPEEEDMTPEQANTLDHIAALLEETPYRSAQQVMHWQVSRVEGVPSTFLQDQTDGVTNTITLVNDTAARSAFARSADLLVLAIVVLLALVAGVAVGLLADTRQGVIAGVAAIGGGLLVTVLRNLPRTS